MGYLYENSNHERFQHLCQSLLVTSHPNLQCLPVGQPNGGRDGWDADSKIVLQVKFKRADEDENAEWLIAALEAELPKVKLLAERGAERYIIATNARGTAHLGSGRIDKVQMWLDENMPVPSVCFWRDEIDRRLDAAPVGLKLKYSELLSLEDGLEVILNTALGADAKRQQDAIHGFITEQFKLDKEVKFKQVSLSNDLLDLFIDVPVGLSRRVVTRTGKHLKSLIETLAGDDASFFMHGDGDAQEVYVQRSGGRLSRLNLGAAELLLSGAIQDRLKLVVLEGAPGQGKSTLAQYVCQMHRARYLKKQDVLDRTPEAHKQTGFRIPFKVDLRDYAAFLGGNSPYSGNSAPSEPRVLEVFLSQLVTWDSKGIPFGPHDVLSLLKSVPTLLFLDGLDEVADIPAREALVASVGDALSRWSDFGADVQVVVTSRPSVFGRAPSFGRFGFETLALQNIDLERINDYAEKWVLARKLDPTEQADVKKILKEKLELAHIRDLTRNPMQLTILLSLIHQVGHSLPDQRTDLYSRYVDLFLTREADKSTRVREHRPVLLGFIQHLAWFLQTQAESSKSAGSITSDALQEMARRYLEDGGHAIEIADNLFGGGLERVFVLVERIEGLYEFEVQPLREFFCAQYLYSTAPVGTYRDHVLRGDRAQRFEALAANPLWLNVCRFYAGSCARGEAGTLVFSLEEMINKGSPATAVHARRVGVALLQDWVFSNVKYIQDQLIRAIFDEQGAAAIIASERHSTESLTLEIECGQATLREQLFALMAAMPVDPRTPLLCGLLRQNGGECLGEAFSELVRAASGEDRTNQLMRMYRAGAASQIEPNRLWELISGDSPTREQLLPRVAELVWNEPDIANQVPHVVDAFIDGVLDGLIVDSGHNYAPLGVFGELLGAGPGPHMGIRRWSSWVEHGRLVEGDGDSPTRIRGFLTRVSQEAIVGDLRWGGPPPLAAVEAVVEASRSEFGETWCAMSLAVGSAGIREAVELPAGSERLFDASVPLCARARAARLRRGGPTWWFDQLDDAANDLERTFWAALVVMWSSVSNLSALGPKVNEIVDSLSDEQYQALTSTLRLTAASRGIRADRKKLTTVDLRPFSSRTSVLVSIACGATSEMVVADPKERRSEPLKSFLTRLLAHESLGDLPPWKEAELALPWAREINRARALRLPLPRNAQQHLLQSSVRHESAEDILREPGSYPAELVNSAVHVVLRRFRPRALASIAKEQDWAFD